MGFFKIDDLQNLQLCGVKDGKYTDLQLSEEACDGRRKYLGLQHDLVPFLDRFEESYMAVKRLILLV